MMSDIAVEAQALKVFFVDMIDRDTEAFTGVLAARRLPNGTGDEKKAREAAILAAMKDASMVPFATLEACLKATDLAERSAKDGNSAVLSDAAVGALCAEAAAESAWFNVLINIGDIDDPEFVTELRGKADGTLEAVRKQSKRVRETVQKAIEFGS
jgi:glutamate formiminotransferase/formiminotetrahydrofolate cyclodeaminase